MKHTPDQQRTWTNSAMRLALNEVRRSPGKLLRAKDIQGASTSAASKALSRLTLKGTIIRQAKGLYYVPKETLAGTSRPHELTVLQARLCERTRPTGATAANLLGLSTQVPARTEVAVYAAAKPGSTNSARVKLRKVPSGIKPVAAELNETDAALLEFLRERGKFSELEPTETLSRLRGILLSQRNSSNKLQTSSKRLQLLVSAALQEPPRVRAMLGALLQWIGCPVSTYLPMKESLNPLTRFDFGNLSALPNATEWQAK